MSHWIVSSLPSWLILTGLIVSISGGSVAIQAVVHRCWPVLRGEEHNDPTRFAFGVVGFVFAFFIGFVVSAMWGQINDADARVRGEGAAALQLARDRTVFDPADSDRIQQSLLGYAHAAVAEWPEVADGRRYPAADRALAQLYRTYSEVQAHTDVQKAFLTTSLSNLDKTSQARSERIMQARTDTGPPWSLWAVIFATSAMVLGCAIIYGVAKPAVGYPMVVTIGVLVAANIFLVLELSHPFVGELSTSAEPLNEVIRVLDGADQ